MKVFKKTRKNLKTDNQTGFGTNASNYGGRFLAKDGSANIEKRGLSFFDQISWFHTLLRLPAWKFQLMIFLVFIFVNFIFATIYYFIGIEHLNGIIASSEIEKFGQIYFFSAQTFTTVGYGHISPEGFLTSAVASGEALIGLLGFAIATGLFYGRFSRPKAHLKFSENAIIAPFQGGKSLMIRVASYKNTNLTDAEAKLTLAMTVEENGVYVNRFFPLDLEYSTINALTLSWTLVHHITEESPLFEFTKDDFANEKGEVLVFLKAFDEMFSNTVAIRTSYIFKEIVYGAKFLQMFKHSNDNTKTIIHIDKLNLFEEINF
ncbi:Inward rectifier potassium channel Irk [Flavobacterium psychrophilum]|uniref:ion channel n=1 Tax=Flavobacterium psychrophilum TaxID=96345 RepID=UPI000B7C254F|nr:ion channel [Flavobacterium psychrophilum]ELM3649110.1 Inward rectifier potassium channel Irk [Flavobacterium psychrophilum]ELM3670830.1 Inward rectifier potassium channel Irk [Flavobacterium psychrophilum]ELM3724669.1 Inward rectifier potassium channel Irk [Flavobacterium psychrophilum]ELY1990889.1 Inward rectifier potassium channel Irk [Flavobacterium psychrophilum]MBF2023593.1 Inward rectifier potassium channel Irk [Flavobacterium psychrophilum]